MKIIKSFKYALTGVKEAFKSEKNMKVHFALAFLAIILAIILNFSPAEWAILILTIGLVFVLELVNTSLEKIVDLVSPEIKEEARIAKDIAAAGVLVSAIISIIIAGFLFLPKII